jgi:hypothetical protein
VSGHKKSPEGGNSILIFKRARRDGFYFMFDLWANRAEFALNQIIARGLQLCHFLKGRQIIF